MKKYLFFLPIFLLIISCREEIISPDNPANNINEPVSSSNGDSYSFLIVADKVSFNIQNLTYLKSLRNSIFFTVSDYQTGEVEIIIYDEQKNILYIYSVLKNTPGKSEIIRGRIPHSVTLKFSNFSGKLNVRITGID